MPAEHGSNCAIRSIDDFVEAPPLAVDGDTLWAATRRLRLIAIDAPELRGDSAPQPWAQQAQEALARRVQGQTLVLQRGVRTVDAHGRELVHVFLQDGTNVQAWMLSQGLATLAPVPPNLNYLACYEAAQRGARGDGLWSLAAYQAVPSTRLDADTRGYRRVRGPLVRVESRGGGVELHLAGALAAYIPAASMPLFAAFDLDALVGNELTLSGEVFRHERGLRMLLPHPALLETPQGAGSALLPRGGRSY